MADALSRELKFILAPDDARRLTVWARENLQPDPHGSGPSHDEYDTSTIYFDTPALDVFHRRGSFGRSKLRIRRYDREPVVFLERKMRTSDMLAKRRTTVPLSRVRGILQGAVEQDTSWFS